MPALAWTRLLLLPAVGLNAIVGASSRAGKGNTCWGIIFHSPWSAYGSDSAIISRHYCLTARVQLCPTGPSSSVRCHLISSPSECRGNGRQTLAK